MTPETNREGGEQVKAKWTFEIKPYNSSARLVILKDGHPWQFSYFDNFTDAQDRGQTIIDALNAHDLKMSHPLICALGEFAIRNQVKHAKDCKSGMHSSHPLQAVSCDCGAFVSALNKSHNETLLEKVRAIVENDMMECSCSHGSFIYGCKHSVRDLRALLTRQPK